ILRQACIERVEVDFVDRMILAEAREDIANLAALRIAMRLEALRGDFFHHALHRRVDRRDAPVPRLQMRLEQRMARAADGGHHLVGTDRDHSVGVAERDGLLTQATRCVRMHRLHDVADKALVLWPPRYESRRLVAAPD